MTILSNLIGRTAIAVRAGVHKSISGVARGALKGLEHPLSQKRKKIELVFSKKKNYRKYYLSVILNTKIGTYIRIYKQIQVLC